MRSYFVLLYVLVAFSGCSVAMALNGNEPPNFDAFEVGSKRKQVEIQLGQPTDTQILENGHTQNSYEFEIGDPPNGHRAVMNFYIDVVTIGIWELPGTIIEAMLGEDKETVVIYDRDERVVQIDGYVPAPSLQAEKITVTEKSE